MKPDLTLTIHFSKPELTLVTNLLRKYDAAATESASRVKQARSLRQAMARCQTAIKASELGERLDRQRVPRRTPVVYDFSVGEFAPEHPEAP
jgi:hypothetical protein